MREDTNAQESLCGIIQRDYNSSKCSIMGVLDFIYRYCKLIEEDHHIELAGAPLRCFRKWKKKQNILIIAMVQIQLPYKYRKLIQIQPIYVKC